LYLGRVKDEEEECKKMRNITLKANSRMLNDE